MEEKKFSFQELCSPQEISASLAEQFKGKLNLSERLINYAIGQVGLKEIEDGDFIRELKKPVNLSVAYRACYIKEDGEPEWKFNPMPMLTGALTNEEKAGYIKKTITGQHPQFFTFKMNVKKWIVNRRCFSLEYFVKQTLTVEKEQPKEISKEQSQIEILRLLKRCGASDKEIEEKKKQWAEEALNAGKKKH